VQWLDGLPVLSWAWTGEHALGRNQKNTFYRRWHSSRRALQRNGNLGFTSVRSFRTPWAITSPLLDSSEAIGQSARRPNEVRSLTPTAANARRIISGGDRRIVLNCNQKLHSLGNESFAKPISMRSENHRFPGVSASLRASANGTTGLAVYDDYGKLKYPYCPDQLRCIRPSSVPAKPLLSAD
jgi:hypothetical protein